MIKINVMQMTHTTMALNSITQHLAGDGPNLGAIKAGDGSARPNSTGQDRSQFCCGALAGLTAMRREAVQITEAAFLDSRRARSRTGISQHPLRS